MNFKKLLCILFAVITIIAAGCVTAMAADINADAGQSGQLEEAAKNSGWWSTDQGVRVSLYEVSSSRVLRTMDVTNLTDAQMGKFDGLIWFGYHHKLFYQWGGRLSMTGQEYKPRHFADATIPPVILAGEGNNIEEVKNFFRDKHVLQDIANKFGIDFDKMTTDAYKILLEPVAYFKLDGEWYAMSATEAAIYQRNYGDSILKIMGNLTNRNLPLSMFLERDDIGISAWTGPRSGYMSVSNIVAYLGIGIISFDGSDDPGVTGRICCDCDKWCPCKYDINGAKRKDGDCWCFVSSSYGHKDHIPCTPDYPDNCLCQKHNIGVLKVVASENSRRLGGAVMRMTSRTTGQVVTGTTDANGLLIFKGLYLGEWYLDEVSAPTGYVRSDDRILISLTVDGVKVYGNITGSSYMGGLAYMPYNDSNPVTVVFQNEKSSLIDPAKGDNILYGYQLTKSFTNSTNFSNTVNYPTGVAPSTQRCSGETYVSGAYGYPYGLTIKGSVKSHYHPEEDYTYDAWEWSSDKQEMVKVKKTVHYDAYYTYDYTYLHNDAHRTDYTWKSGNVTVLPGAYLSSGSFSSGGMEKYKILHNGGNYLFGFNLSGSYIVKTTRDLFGGLTAKTWVSHRNGALTYQTQEIKLAAYMADQNAAYKSFYQTYTGNTPTASNSNDSNTSHYGTKNDISMSTSHGGDCDREYLATYCNGGTHYEQYRASTNSATQAYKYSVEGTYKAGARSIYGSDKYSQYVTSGYDSSYTQANGTRIVFAEPSNSFSFYPTYRMWYTDTLGQNDGSTAWMLSAGRRTFQATDIIQVTTSGGTTDVWAPWSRDWEDRYTDDSVYGNETKRPYSVIKSGMVVKAVQETPATITIQAVFHIQDPKYAINGSESTVKAANEAKAREMMAEVEKLAASYTGNGTLNAQFGFYSNLWEATSSNIASRLPVLDVQPASYATSESPKTRLEPIKYKNAAAPTYSYQSFTASPEVPVGTFESITIAGKSYTALGSNVPSNNINKYTHSKDAMGYLLDTAYQSKATDKYYIGEAANSMAEGGKRWYDEYYDGIRVCVITCKIAIPSESLKTEYHQVHSQLSDSTTAMNAEAKNILVYGNKLFKDGMFGIGLCAIPEAGSTIFGQTYNRAVLFWPAKHFGVRGSVYDLAQNSDQELLYYNSAWY